MEVGTIVLRLYCDDQGRYFTQVVQWPEEARFDPFFLDQGLIEEAQRSWCRLLKGRGLLGPPDEVYKMGALLRQIMLPISILKPFLLLLADRRRLKLCWQVESPELSSLPWECVYIDPRALRELRRDREFAERCHEFLKERGGPFFPILPHAGQRLTFLRLPPVQFQSQTRLQPLGKLRLLLAVADPRRDLHPNAPAVLQPLQELGRRVEVDILTHVRRRELEARLTEAEPYHAFIFYGHGEHRGPGESILLLEAESGDHEPLRAEELANWLIKKPKRPIAIAVLIACESGVELAHRLVEAGVPAVVALQAEIEEADARDFCEVFFQELVRGSPLEECIAAGRQALSRRLGEYVDRFEWAIPVLVTSSPETELFQPADPLANIPFVGREREYEHLVEELEAARGSRGRAVFLAGEAGVGKTRLAQELMGYARLRYPTLLLEGRAQELQQLMGFYPLAEAIREGLRRLPPQELEGIPPLWLAEVAEVVPELREMRPELPRNPELPPKEAKLRRFEGLTQFFLGLAGAQRLVVLFLDDLQWADSLTLEFLSYFLPRIEKRPFLILGAYRSEEVAREHPLRSLVQAGQRQRLLSQLELGRLPAEAVGALMQQLAPTLPRVEAFARRLHGETEGNPFFIVSVLRSFLEAGLVRVKGKEWVPRVEDLTADYKALMVPKEVKEVILRRVERLSAGEQKLLRLAAVLGQGFEYEVLQRAWEGDGECLGLLEGLLEKGLVLERPGPVVRYDFSHDKIREVIYEETALVRRQLLHRRVVQALEQVYGAKLEDWATLLAQHAYRAGAWKKALEYSLQALKRAVKEYRHQEGLALAALGLDAAQKLEAAGEDRAYLDSQRFALLAERVEVFSLQGRRQEQGQDIDKMEEMAEQLQDKGKQALTFRKRNDLYYRTGKYHEAKEAARQALRLYEEVGDKRGQGACMNSIGIVYSVLGQYEEALRYHKQALKITQELGDQRSQGDCLHSIGNIYWYLSRYKEALSCYQQALQTYRVVGERRGQAVCLGNIALTYSNLGLYEEALRYHQQDLEICQELGDRQGQAYTLGNIGDVYRYLQRYEEALRYHQQALEIFQEVRDRRGQGINLGNIGLINWRSGRYDKALQCYQQTLEIFQELGDRRGQGTCLSNIGLVYWSLGRYEEALRYCQQSLQIHQELGNRQGQADCLNNIGLVYWSLGRYEEALHYFQQSLQIRQEIGDKQGQGYCLDSIGDVYRELGQYSEVLKYYEQACAIFEELGTKAEQLECLSAEAIAHLGLDEKDKALACSSQAIQTLEGGQTCDNPHEVYFNHFKIISAHGRDEEARKYLQKAYDEVMQRAEKITDPQARESFLTNVKANREILEAWERQAGRGGG